MAKGTFQAETTLNSEKIKPIALATLQAVRQLVSQSVENSVK